METAEPVGIAAPNEAELTDSNIQHLLLEAESRLRSHNPAPATQRLKLPSPRIPELSPGCKQQLYVRQGDDIATTDPSRMNGDIKSNPVPPTPGKGLLAEDAQAKKEKQTAGGDWFNLPRTELTPELKRDLQILRMRSVLDPKRHYKKENGKIRPPEYSQVGTVIEGPGEFFSGRITKKDRKKTFVEEVLASERETHRFESKYQDIQATKRSGKGLYYKNLRAKRATRGK